MNALAGMLPLMVVGGIIGFFAGMFFMSAWYEEWLQAQGFKRR